MQRPFALFFSAGVIVLFACGGSTPAASPEPAGAPAPAASHGAPGHHGHHPDFPACTVLAKTCHTHDKDSDKAHACHVLGHSAPSNEECEAKRAECLAICGGDGGA
jgi:hypothetical protein